jgi:hypothetical protein
VSFSLLLGLFQPVPVQQNFRYAHLNFRLSPYLVYLRSLAYYIPMCLYCQMCQPRALSLLWSDF